MFMRSLASALFSNLQLISDDHVMVGHQDALAYGMGHMGDAENIDEVLFEDMIKWAIAVYEKGGMNTFSWSTSAVIFV
jgi:hypothetical protein